MSDLSAPLTRRRDRRGGQPRAPRRHLPIARIAFAGIVVLLGAAALRVMLVETPDGGRPSAEVPINSTHNANSIAGANATMPAGIITVGPEISPDAVEAALPADAEGVTRAPDDGELVADLVEESDYGQLPRISATGETPFEAYSRPSVTAASADGKPLVAIVVTGLGLNLDGTLEALNELPDNVTLGFAPYSKSLDRTVEAARAEGHEIFLEVPLEPFDYPENDPGPDTLLTGQAPRDNMDRLYRVMGKFGGYAGLINNMGARFTASAADFGPMMEELGARGLGYIDDGSSNRSLAPQLSAANGVPFGQVASVLDNNPAPAPINEALDALEDQARREGSAIGLVSALPVSVHTVAEWAATLEEKGILLVPASALMK